MKFMKKMGLKSMTAGVLLAAFGQAQATQYQYQFLANPDADGTSAVNPALDVHYTFGFDSSALPGYSLQTLTNTSYWASGAIWLKMSYQGKTVNLLDAIDTSQPTVSFSHGQGVIEFFGESEFLDIDFHGGSPLVDGNQLPYTPFVYGQLDIYNQQPAFQDAYALWTRGDTSRLANYAAVPEPSTTMLLFIGMGLIGAMRQRRHQA